jgi:hypothetical protein
MNITKKEECKEQKRERGFADFFCIFAFLRLNIAFMCCPEVAKEMRNGHAKCEVNSASALSTGSFASAAWAAARSNAANASAWLRAMWARIQ